MTARSDSDRLNQVTAIGEVLSGKKRRADTRRTHQRVHRKSHHAGEIEERAWAQHNRFPRSENNARMRALEELERHQRHVDRVRLDKEGKPVLGPDGTPECRRRRREDSVMLGVYRYLIRLRGKKTGRLDPAYETIAAALNYAASAVKAAMKRLEALGFLSWMRRTRLLDEPDPGGQYVTQISNAYVLDLRGRAAELVRRILRRLSPDAQRRRDGEARAAELATMTSSDAVASVSDPALRQALEVMRTRIENASPPQALNPALLGK